MRRKPDISVYRTIYEMPSLPSLVSFTFKSHQWLYPSFLFLLLLLYMFPYTCASVLVGSGSFSYTYFTHRDRCQLRKLL